MRQRQSYKIIDSALTLNGLPLTDENRLHVAMAALDTPAVYTPDEVGYIPVDDIAQAMVDSIQELKIKEEV